MKIMVQPVATARSRRAPPVFICKKCLGRVDDGKAVRKALKSELKQASQARDIKGPRVVLAGCLGICPKRAVVVASAATLAADRYLLLPSAAAVPDAVDSLMPPQA